MTRIRSFIDALEHLADEKLAKQIEEMIEAYEAESKLPEITGEIAITLIQTHLQGKPFDKEQLLSKLQRIMTK